METVYRSKIDAWLVALLGVAVAVSLAGAVATLSVPSAAAWAVGAFIAVVGVGLPLWLLVSTRYRLGRGQLLVRSGPFKWRIQVADITNITPTSSPLSSPALSLDRLRIDYGRGKSLMISPLHKDRFLVDMEAARRGAVYPLSTRTAASPLNSTR